MGSYSYRSQAIFFSHRFVYLSICVCLNIIIFLPLLFVFISLVPSAFFLLSRRKKNSLLLLLNALTSERLRFMFITKLIGVFYINTSILDVC